MSESTLEHDIQRILEKNLKGLDSTIQDYLVSMISESEDLSREALNESIGPFLLSTGYVENENEIEEYCGRIALDLKTEQVMKGMHPMDDLKKLDVVKTIEDMSRSMQDDGMIEMMWGFDKIRKEVNELRECQVAQSQRQIRKQIKTDRINDEREKLEAELDRQWEDEKILPDLSTNTGEKDIHVLRFTLSFKGACLLSDATLKLTDGRKYGLVGKNGIGKTTLLRYMSRYEIEGFPKHLRIQHVDQESASKLSLDQKSVIQVVLAADHERSLLLEKEKNLTQNEGSNTALKEVYDRLVEIDADGAESRARMILVGLQFSPAMIDGPASALSGGWRMRAALAGALFMAPDLLLLDEPTNHLDIEAVIWLEDYLQKYQKTLVVVSHDRKFLDSIITDVIYLHNQKLEYYKGDYGIFERTRSELLRQQRKAYDAQQQKIAHMQEFIDRFRCNAKKASLVQSRIKAIEKMELVEEPEDEQAFRMTFPPPEPLGRPIIAVSDVSFGYEGKESLFTDVQMGIDMQSRIGILGVNGSGKSTLINIILGKLNPNTGQAVRNPRLRLASFTQHHVDQLALAKTAVQNMTALFPGHEPQEFRSHLGRFNISGELAIKPTRKLSGGQKSRVAFAILTWTLPHVIILDEPTNHLDMETIDALIKALKDYQGGVVIVSHDEHFVTSICQELWVVGKGKVNRFLGTMEDYKKMLKH